MRLSADVCSLKNKVQWVLALCNFWAWEKVALAKYLACAFFGLFSSLLHFLAYFWPKNCSNEIVSPKIALAKYKKRSNEINSPKNAYAKYFWIV